MTSPEDPLNNAIWHALIGPHARVALGDGFARRYPPDVLPFAGLAANEAQCLQSLARVTTSGEVLTLAAGDGLHLTTDWTLVQQITVHQMVQQHHAPAVAPLPSIVPLGPADVPAMLHLAGLTEPGPFLPRTLELGTYLGIWDGTALAAMAGLRLHVPGYREICTVCTHPAYRGRGYARALVSSLLRAIRSAGEVPFLHVVPENGIAIALYASLGFVVRRSGDALLVQRC